MNSLKAILLIVAILFPLQALAADLVGEYDGQVKHVDGYSGKVGDPCVASITQSESIGGILKFSLNGAETLEFEQKKVNDALQSGKKKVELLNKGGTFGRDIEVANLSLGNDGTLKFLKLTRKYPFKSSFNKSIACSDLKKR